MIISDFSESVFKEYLNVYVWHVVVTLSKCSWRELKASGRRKIIDNVFNQYFEKFCYRRNQRTEAETRASCSLSLHETR